MIVFLNVLLIDDTYSPNAGDVASLVLVSKSLKLFAWARFLVGGGWSQEWLPYFTLPKKKRNESFFYKHFKTKSNT